MGQSMHPSATVARDISIDIDDQKLSGSFAETTL